MADAGLGDNTSASAGAALLVSALCIACAYPPFTATESMWADLRSARLVCHQSVSQNQPNNPAVLPYTVLPHDGMLCKCMQHLHTL